MVTLEELQAKKASLESRLRGLRVFLAFPELPDNVRTEFNESFADRTAKYDAVKRFIETEAYLEDKETASSEAIVFIADLTSDVDAVLPDFIAPTVLSDSLTVTVD
jgi:hypothetical protein